MRRRSAAAKYLHIERIETDIGLLQSLEAAVNLLILFGGAAWFLITTEERLKRQRALDELHTLRSLAHVVDMHQLTKDPTLVLEAHRMGMDGPPRAMSQFELARYLDYCAELLALLGKLAALYADRMRDSVVISAVTEISGATPIPSPEPLSRRTSGDTRSKSAPEIPTPELVQLLAVHRVGFFDVYDDPALMYVVGVQARCPYRCLDHQQAGRSAARALRLANGIAG